jgi:SAM-dependent methyltransferase
MLTKTLQEGEDNSLRVLDFGAGNGLVAEKLNEQDPDIIIGVDILKSAKNAASRDRKGLYEDYLVSDLARPEGGVMKKLESYEFNAMVSVAALGFGHIPPLAFVNAFNLVETSGLIAFNIRDKFLTREDETGFRATLDRMTGESLETIDEKIYRHRYALNGEPINYVAIVARKITDMENPAGPKLNTDLDTESFEVKNS